MVAIITLLFLINAAFAVHEGEILFKNHCIKCHAQDSKKPLKYLRQKFQNNPEGVIQLAKRCPWGQGLSDMEVKLIAEWLSGSK
ncbi:cytochrome c553 [Hydrogenivirga caldilitoris]|uniref:Cytochrome c553 n=1 Tax=Hydrogenivirga caldilitoris TaxID=246264 RepID=A0A497XPZ1_9AQUI|nr:cytochrome c [Hydrogenivirga caldilitoris]RLJ70968.1 cytochrome c553 [Hydrogenivirga caldilitoris]